MLTIGCLLLDVEVLDPGLDDSTETGYTGCKGCRLHDLPAAMVDKRGGAASTWFKTSKDDIGCASLGVSEQLVARGRIGH